jgi:hypothetical protein
VVYGCELREPINSLLNKVGHVSPQWRNGKADPELQEAIKASRDELAEKKRKYEEKNEDSDVDDVSK